MVDLEIDESKVWSEEERQAYADALPEMSLFEDHIVEGDPMVDALQALAEEGETNQTMAVHWKTKGNEMFLDGKKYNKNYFNDAMVNYDKAYYYGVKALGDPVEELVEEQDPKELLSTILSNRAAVHLEWKNYGSCRSDCALAIKHWSKNIKAYYRGAKASFALRKPKDVKLYCEVGLRLDPSNTMLVKLLQKNKKLQQDVDAEMQLELFKQKKRRAATEKYRQLCVIRDVKVGSAGINDQRVVDYEGKADLDSSDGAMYWPVLFLYDEYGMSDFIEFFSENNMFIEHLANMFPEDGPFCPWDSRHEYVASRLDIYAMLEAVPEFSSEEAWHVALSKEAESDELEAIRIRAEELNAAKTKWWVKVSPFCTLHQLLSHPKYVVPGIPMVNLVVRGTAHEKEFLNKIEHKVLDLSEK